MSEATAVAHTGLLVEGAPVPLEGVQVDAQIRSCAARVTLRQRYRNCEPCPVEAVYVFPIDEGAAVCGFEVQIDGVRVVGRVEERDAAFARYDDALAAGHGGYLLDQERPDIFSASIGNIAPGAEVTITIVTVAEVALAGDDLRFVLPTTVAPRYAPAVDRVGVGRTPADALNPPRVLRVPYGLNVTVDVDLGVPLRAVESPSHPIALELDGARARVRLGERAAALDRDFVLCLRALVAPRAQAWIEADAHGDVGVMLTFVPHFEAGAAPSEVLFLVDRSGSMDGTSIAEARNALQLCLRSLTDDDFFNIIGFGSRHDVLFPESRRYDEDSLATASAHVGQLQADLGGTEILGALEAAFSMPARPGLARQLFVLTDGQVTNTAAVLRCARQHGHRARIFTFGIGAGASQHLVRGLARAGHGAAEFIAPGERLEGKVLRQLARALAPAVSDVRIDWGGLPVEQAPHRLPPLFAGERSIVYGLLRGEPRPARVVLRGRTPAGALEAELDIDPATARHERTVVTLAARALIRDLEERTSARHEQDGSQQAREDDSRVKEAIVRLATTYGLASSCTSFVAVEERATPLHDQAQLRRVPVALTRGWGALEDARLGLAAGARPEAPPAAAATTSPMPPRAPKPRPPRGASATPEVDFDAASEAEAVPLPALAYVHEGRPAAQTVRPLDHLVALQRADGSWDLTPGLARALDRPLAEFEFALRGARGDVATVRRAWATALALSWLERHAADCRDEWRLLARKAEAWLQRCAARPATGDWCALAADLKL